MVNPILCCVCQSLLKEEDKEQICLRCFTKATSKVSAEQTKVYRQTAILLKGLVKLELWLANLYAATATRLELEGGPVPSFDREPYKTIKEIREALNELG